MNANGNGDVRYFYIRRDGEHQSTPQISAAARRSPDRKSIRVAFAFLRPTDNFNKVDVREILDGRLNCDHACKLVTDVAYMEHSAEAVQIAFNLVPKRSRWNRVNLRNNRGILTYEPKVKVALMEKSEAAEEMLSERAVSAESITA